VCAQFWRALASAATSLNLLCRLALAEGVSPKIHLKVLDYFGSVAAIRSRMRACTEEQMERERLEREQQVRQRNSTEISAGTAPHSYGYELRESAFPVTRSARLYDFIQPRKTVGWCRAGDVSGKARRCLLSSSLHAAVHAQADIHDSLVKLSAQSSVLVDSIPANRSSHFMPNSIRKTEACHFLNAATIAAIVIPEAR